MQTLNINSGTLNKFFDVLSTPSSDRVFNKCTRLLRPKLQSYLKLTVAFSEKIDGEELLGNVASDVTTRQELIELLTNGKALRVIFNEHLSPYKTLKVGTKYFSAISLLKSISDLGHDINVTRAYATIVATILDCYEFRSEFTTISHMEKRGAAVDVVSDKSLTSELTRTMYYQQLEDVLIDEVKRHKTNAKVANHVASSLELDVGNSLINIASRLSLIEYNITELEDVLYIMSLYLKSDYANLVAFGNPHEGPAFDSLLSNASLVRMALRLHDSTHVPTTPAFRLGNAIEKLNRVLLSNEAVESISVQNAGILKLPLNLTSGCDKGCLLLEAVSQPAKYALCLKHDIATLGIRNVEDITKKEGNILPILQNDPSTELLKLYGSLNWYNMTEDDSYMLHYDVKHRLLTDVALCLSNFRVATEGTQIIYQCPQAVTLPLGRQLPASWVPETTNPAIVIALSDIEFNVPQVDVPISPPLKGLFIIENEEQIFKPLVDFSIKIPGMDSVGLPTTVIKPYDRVEHKFKYLVINDTWVQIYTTIMETWKEVSKVNNNAFAAKSFANAIVRTLLTNVRSNLAFNNLQRVAMVELSKALVKNDKFLTAMDPIINRAVEIGICISFMEYMSGVPTAQTLLDEIFSESSLIGV